jgi:electron transfer flavoprotein beta subunit
LNIAVCICLVSDVSSHIVLTPDSKHIERDGLTLLLNPFDEYAIEEAVRTKEKLGGTVHVISIGGEQNKEIVRKAIAMGADEGIIVRYDGEMNSLLTADVLAQVILPGGYDMVFMGKQTTDYSGGCVGQLTAELCNYHCISSCISLQVEGSDVSGDREIENGIESVKTTLPVVITTQKGINEPRYPSLKGIMAAKKRTIAEKNIEPGTSRISESRLELSIQKGKTHFFENDPVGIAELVHVLIKDTRVI